MRGSVSTLALVPCLAFASSCALSPETYELPTLEQPVTADVVDIHAHFFNFCDLPQQALRDKFHVDDQGAMRSIAGAGGAVFIKKRGNEAERVAICNDVLQAQGARRLMEGKYKFIDFARAAVSDRLAIASAYFRLFPEVGLVTPSMVDPDGWLNNPNDLPPSAGWDVRHKMLRELAEHINDENQTIRVLPIAGFNPMRGVTIDCGKTLEFADAERCEAEWAWRASGPAGDAYLRAFEALFDPADGGLPFVGIKIYPSTGFSPSSHCDEIAKRWPNGGFAAFVAMAPIRNPEQWEALPEPADTSGCYEAHRELMEKLRNDAGAVARERFGGRDAYLPGADVDDIRIQIQLVAFLRLSAEIDRVMAEMVTMAERLDLPIIAHASAEGFALDDEFYQYGSPCEWEPTLAAHPRLRVLLAHAGGSKHEGKKKERSFFDDVADLVQRNRNVYVDYSNRPSGEWSDTDATRAVYGSDFFMMTLGGRSAGYLESHNRMFDSPQETDAYMRGNAIDFLAGATVDTPYTGNRARICNYAQRVGMTHAPGIHGRMCP